MAIIGDIPALVPRTALVLPVQIGSQVDRCQASCVEKGQEDPGVLLGRTWGVLFGTGGSGRKKN